MLKIDSANKSFQLPYQLLSQTKNEELMLNAVARIEVGQQARERGQAICYRRSVYPVLGYMGRQQHTDYSAV